MNPKYPVYIVSKGRWKRRQTIKSLEYMNVPFKVIIEKEEFDNYAEVVGADRLLILPPKYLDEYDTFDEVDDPARSKGPGSARNFAWDHAISIGAEYHWVLDDNLEWFYRFNNNTKIKCDSGTVLRCAEDFVTRYDNVAVAGLNYEKFCPKTDNRPAFRVNTRVYSCLFIRNDMPYRWRGRYNEDTDLSLRVMKDGLCTILFNAFLCGKRTTQIQKGGNTTEFYEKEGTLLKSQMLADMHPDVAKVVWKFNRWHHHVDYRPFKHGLIRKEGLVLKDEINNYGLKIVDIKKK